jgi:hypothetical protein
MPGQVVCLCGNHDDWFLRTLRDFRQHTWLLATDAFKTIESYSVDAAHVLREAVSRAGPALYGEGCALPYGVFFDRVPASHIQFSNACAPTTRVQTASVPMEAWILVSRAFTNRLACLDLGRWSFSPRV